MVDVSLPLLQNCNLLSTLGGLTSTGTLLFTDSIISWTRANSTEWYMLAGLLGFTTAQVMNDAVLSIYTLQLWVNHFDLRNLAYLGVKAANNAMLLYSTTQIFKGVLA